MDAPTLIQTGFSLSGAYRFNTLPFFTHEFRALLGLTTDYRMINQYSTVNDELGNSRGSRWVILAPTLGAIVDQDYILRLELQFLGNYKLSNRTFDGKDFSYTSPFGFKLSALKIIGDRNLAVGLLFEQVRYKAREISGVGSRTLNPALSIYQVGLMVSYAFQ